MSMSLSTSLKIFDQFSQPLNNITNAMNSTLTAMNILNSFAKRDINVSTQMNAARNSIRQDEIAFKEIEV